MKSATVMLAACLFVASCAQTKYQVYEGRGGPQILEGQGGTKEIVDGIDIWDNGTPPRRYQVLGVAVIDDFDNPLGRSRIRSALVKQVKDAGADAAVVMSEQGQGTSMGMAFGPGGTMAAGPIYGSRSNRYQIVKYLDK